MYGIPKRYGVAVGLALQMQTVGKEQETKDFKVHRCFFSYTGL
jgi:hypothetical protein